MSTTKQLDPVSDLMKAGIFSVTPFGGQIWSIACTDDEIESSLRRYAAQSNDYVLIKAYGKPELSVVSIRTYLFYEYEPNRKVYELTMMPAKSVDKQILDEPKLLDEVLLLLRIINVHYADNGRFQVESRIGHGTTLTMKILLTRKVR
ncbi:hypothetical protein [Paenibacillus sp. PL91]|uniref:hypothetical protein n=1 Tax=Paenibacillus sp. PL91 TaxID=2729538 RepID=UPI00145F0E63|nr:hypothetical protein [Paenibacillus sp. PL91]MBC9204063.1 hypothetical protein [Paenibacillus sp. PL91]